MGQALFQIQKRNNNNVVSFTIIRVWHTCVAPLFLIVYLKENNIMRYCAIHTDAPPYGAIYIGSKSEVVHKILDLEFEAEFDLNGEKKRTRFWMGRKPNPGVTEPKRRYHDYSIEYSHEEMLADAENFAFDKLGEFGFEVFQSRL